MAPETVWCHICGEYFECYYPPGAAPVMCGECPENAPDVSARSSLPDAHRSRAWAELKLHATVSSLLAVIHGDGGSYAEEHGMAKACADAEAVVIGLRADYVNMSSALNRSIQALGLERRARADLEAEAIDLRAELDAQKKRFDPRCAQAVDCAACGD